MDEIAGCARAAGSALARYSALAINPHFRRRPTEGEAKRLWAPLEVACSPRTLTLLALVATGMIPLRAFAIGTIVAVGVAVINQPRMLLAQ